MCTIRHKPDAATAKLHTIICEIQRNNPLPPLTWVLPHPKHTSKTRTLRERHNRAINSCSCTIRRQTSTGAHDDSTTSLVDNVAMSKSRKQLSYTSRTSNKARKHLNCACKQLSHTLIAPRYSSTSIAHASNSRTPRPTSSNPHDHLSRNTATSFINRSISSQHCTTVSSHGTNVGPFSFIRIMCFRITRCKHVGDVDLGHLKKQGAMP